jgi:hypothetical protein
MKIETIHVNKNPQQPDGVPVEIVVPESSFETELLAFTLRGYVEVARQANNLSVTMNPGYQIVHQGNGSFVVAGQVNAPENPYYQQPRALALVGVRKVPGGFDILHADLTPEGQERAKAMAAAGTAAVAK